MNKKRVFLAVIVIMLLVLPFVLADDDSDSDAEADTSTNTADSAYACLKTKLGTNCGSLNNSEDISFALLAMAYDSDIQQACHSALLNEKTGNCWEEVDDCELKQTSLAILALDNIGVDVEPYTDWLLEEDQKIIAKELNWYLQMDTSVEAEMDCEVEVDGTEYDITIGADKKIKTALSSTCLSRDASGYYLQINPNCYDEEFIISCNQDFITSTFYKLNSVFFISDKVNSASSSGKTSEKVNGYCFTTSSSCDYEGSAWAVLALAKANKDISPYLPYLYSEFDKAENIKYFPSAFLYMLTHDNEYYIEIKDKQKQNKYWEESVGNKFYDSSLALLSLQNLGLEEITNSKDYFLEIQDNDGCWGSDVKKTAFLLYAGWPKPPIILTGSSVNCKKAGFFCVAAEDCSSADRKSYSCSGGDVCCSDPGDEETCQEKSGTICPSGTQCSVTERIASDTLKCCVGECTLSSTQTQCASYSYNCRDSCLTGEEENAYTCDSGKVCCQEKQARNLTWIIILLIILIILIVLAIIFRNQLKIWFFKLKSGFKKGAGPSPTKRPPAGPQPPLLRRPQPSYRPAMRQLQTKRPLIKNKDFSDTMRKLREMTK